MSDIGNSVIDHALWRASVRQRLATWFRRNARDLPWRANPTPYHVWVSEVMLQQTQVATVVDYFNRFIARFPTVKSLALADESELMKIWEGLGYYRRARMMHQAAMQIVENHDGVFPVDFKSVLALPGIGRYTAGAILSISTDAKLPIVEGNTVRVFSRWTAMQSDVKGREGVEQLWKIAEAMLPRTGTGRFNQAAMELGALLCKPIAPACDKCPVASLCEAKRLGLQDSIPGKVTKMVYEDRREFAFIVPVLGRDGWLVCRVPKGERWAGLWDFPRVTDQTTHQPADAARTLSRRLGVELSHNERLIGLKHAVTRFRISLDVHLTDPVEAEGISLAATDYQIVSAAELTAIPLSITGRRIAKWLAGWSSPK